MKNRRNEYELEVVGRLHEVLPVDVDVMVLADRGFGDRKLFAWLDTIGWGYVIRFREGITVTCADERKPASEWVPSSGHAKLLRDVRITQDKTPIAGVVVKHQKGMKES